MIMQGLINAANGGCKVVYGTYTGDGNASRTFTFDGKPVAIATQRLGNSHTYHTRLAFRGMTQTAASFTSSSSGYVTLSWNDTSVTLTRFADEYGNDTIYNFNASSNTYAYFAIIE